MASELTLVNLFGIIMIFVLGVLGMKLFKNILLQLLSFLIPVLIAASLAGFLDLVQGAVGVVFALIFAIIALVLILVYKLVKQIGGWVHQLGG